ncbi:hypothetical protein ACFZB9_30825 [Kitasatospora sp. NPDC008050]
MKQLMFHDDPAFWFETLRNLGLAAYGGSDARDPAEYHDPFQGPG